MSDTALRFPADESCDFGVVQALRAEGFDVVALTEITSRTVDSEAFVVMQPGQIRVRRNK